MDTPEPTWSDINNLFLADFEKILKRYLLLVLDKNFWAVAFYSLPQCSNSLGW